MSSDTGALIASESAQLTINANPKKPTIIMPNAIGMRANARTSMTAKPIRDSAMDQVPADGHGGRRARRSEEHTSELQSLMRISYAVFCLKKKKTHNNQHKAYNIVKNDIKKTN